MVIFDGRRLILGVKDRILLGLEFVGEVSAKVSVWSKRLEGRSLAAMIWWGLDGIIRLNVNLKIQ